MCRVVVSCQRHAADLPPLVQLVLKAPPFSEVDPSFNASTALFVNARVLFSLAIGTASQVRPDDKETLTVNMFYSSKPCPSGYFRDLKCAACPEGESETQRSRSG